ncbi:DUF6710 family protein [Staphylococcus sp. NWU MKU2]|uniref:DUF6710 family protein n=1 Tax=Staphylococcus sp. NWU MKU2 TaxID=3075821 RepID=UPI00295F1B81|nr:DUF6710 family protein [Staphylococcus sp. NWU MKU2]
MNSDIQNNKTLMKLEAKDKRKSNRTNAQLNTVLEQAIYILKENPRITYEQQHPIFSYIKIFTDLIQSKLTITILKNGRDNINTKRNKWFNTVDAYLKPIDQIFLANKFSKATLFTNTNLVVSNARDPIITHIWNANRLSDAIRNIGEGMVDKSFLEIGMRKENKFNYDNLNHKGEYIYPLGIINIYNGNHSISAGLNKSEGYIVIDEVIDISYLYDIYEFDGKYLINKQTNEKEEIYFEFGAIFEIGRLILDKKEVFSEAVQNIINTQEPFKI